MAVWEKELELNSGIITEGYGERIAYMKNLIRSNGALVKRQGQRVACRFENEELLPMRINGIFAFGDYLIVHAADRLYKCTRDFLSVEPILMDNADLADEKSSAFSLDGRLFIECNGAYVYDGVSLSCLGNQDEIYVPKTRVGIRNTKSGFNGKSYENPNLLTPKRVNTMLGEANEDRVSAFMLDSLVLKGSKLDVTVKIRLKPIPKEGEEEVIEGTSYTGIDSDGNEIDGIAIIKYHVNNYGNGNVYRISEPITDENGNEISIRTADGSIYTYKTILWTLQIFDKELRLNMELIPPYPDEDNIEIVFLSSEIEGLNNVKRMSVISCKGGESVLALCFDDGLIHYTSPTMGWGYLPSDNRIVVGAASTKIQRLINLQNGYIGVFTNDGFYKIGMPSDGEGVSAYKTGDMLLLSSPYAVACLGNETLALADDGIYGIKTLSGYQDRGIYLEKRSKRIDSLISSFTDVQKENAHMLSIGDMLYLFLGDKVLVTGKELRKKDNTYAIEQYEWYLLDGMNARCSVAIDSTLYMGRENGAVSVLCDCRYDLEERELSMEKMEFYTVGLEGKTAIVTPYLSWLENGDFASGGFDIRVTTVSCYGNRAQASCKELFNDDNSLRIFENQGISLYKNGERIYSGTVLEIDSALGVMTFDFVCEDGEYELYKVNEKEEYEIELMNDAFVMKDGKKYLEISGVEKIKIAKRRDILTAIVINGIELSRQRNPKMVEYVSIKPTSNTSGSIKIVVEGQRGRKSSALNIAEPLCLDKLCLNKFGLNKQFDKIYKVPTMLFTDCYVSLKIEACGRSPFGIEGISIGWKGEK